MLPRMLSTKNRLDDTRFQVGEDRLKNDYGTMHVVREPPERIGTQKCRSRPINPRKWMSFIEDDTPLSSLTIPGTHDSAAYTSSWPFVATQKLDIRSQLAAGIRYFDFRCGLKDDVPEMVHGITYLGMTLEAVLNVMYSWLEKHPSEALIVQIKEDRERQDSTVTFAHSIYTTLLRKSERWRTASTPCTLGEARGRIQLFRRFAGPEYFAYGLDVTRWQDNPVRPFTICGPYGVQITIQDHYTFPAGTTLPELIRRKGGDVYEMLQLASNDWDLDHWYLNFTSAYELRPLYQINPHQVAVGGYWGFRWEDGMNIRLRGYLRGRENEKKRLGIVAMDFPEQGSDDLLMALVLSNFDDTEDDGLDFVVVVLILVLLVCCGLLSWTSGAVIPGTSSP